MQKKVIRYGQRSTTLDIRELLGLTGSYLLIDRVPQGLKPASFAIPSGTAEAVPFPKPFMKIASCFLARKWRSC
jgi:hypothetical protein